jgi:hypothetical protein
MATRKADTLKLEADAAVATPMAYRTAFVAMLLAAVTEKAVAVVLTAETDAPLVAAMDAEAETNLVALTDTALCAAMTTLACDTTMPPMAMALVAATLAAGSKDPLE